MIKPTLILTGLTVAYLVVVVAPNYIEREKYAQCAADSITEEQASTLNYGGNIRNELAKLKTCSDNNGKAVFEDRSLLIPSILQ